MLFERGLSLHHAARGVKGRPALHVGLLIEQARYGGHDRSALVAVAGGALARELVVKRRFGGATGEDRLKNVGDVYLHCHALHGDMRAGRFSRRGAHGTGRSG